MFKHVKVNLPSALMLLLVAVFAVTLTSCSSKENSQKTANLVYVNWAEGVAYTNLAKVILEDKMDYKVTITAADVGPAYTAVAQGTKDAFMETWLPVLHKDYVDRFKDKIVDLGHVFDGTQSGLVVPDYVTIDQISELNDNKDKFDGQIVGIDAGAGIMKTSDKLIGEYSLNYKLISSSGPAMTAALKQAISNNKWIVVTGWRPHWMFARWNLKFLKQDPDKMMWKKGSIHIMGRKDLETAKPELAQFLKNYHFTNDQLADLMLKVEESDQDIEVVARKWMNEHPKDIDTWIPKN
ncbi:MAG: glycine betaine ABC transporter substrate-binding protein [Candidatus Marinimicrobia bacterium]|nr:glycine betaine ABC transporter substrate-binding protein [Candidatus Neomarinimicrobiota bacterium]